MNYPDIFGLHIRRKNGKQHGDFGDNRTNYHSKFEQGTRNEFN